MSKTHAICPATAGRSLVGGMEHAGRGDRPRRRRDWWRATPLAASTDATEPRPNRRRLRRPRHRCDGSAEGTAAGGSLPGDRHRHRLHPGRDRRRVLHLDGVRRPGRRRQLGAHRRRAGTRRLRRDAAEPDHRRRGGERARRHPRRAQRRRGLGRAAAARPGRGHPGDPRRHRRQRRVDRRVTDRLGQLPGRRDGRRRPRRADRRGGHGDGGQRQPGHLHDRRPPGRVRGADRHVPGHRVHRHRVQQQRAGHRPPRS